MVVIWNLLLMLSTMVTMAPAMAPTVSTLVMPDAMAPAMAPTISRNDRFRFGSRCFDELFEFVAGERSYSLLLRLCFDPRLKLPEFFSRAHVSPHLKKMGARTVHFTSDWLCRT
jgi:hypothetical protein